MTEVRKTPCEACPYRCDVPSGVWDAAEYAKLPPYDAPTGEQPFQGFACHAGPEKFCHGWAVVHSSRGHEYDLLALRLIPAEVPEPTVPLFASGSEAAEHGLREVDAPSTEARVAGDRLRKKHPRLRQEA